MVGGGCVDTTSVDISGILSKSSISLEIKDLTGSEFAEGSHPEDELSTDQHVS